MAWLWFAFFLSGVAGLSYELTWLRYLTQLFGASTPAVSATVSIFFVGLALGSAVGSRVFSRLSRPLRAYGWLEISIGVVALLLPLAFDAAEGILIQTIRADGENVRLLLLFASALLLLPTSLLGATFPAMAAVVKERKRPTESTGFFYGLNTLGAVLGCVLASFWALPAFGQRGTTWLMALVNITVGLGVLWMAMTSRASREEDKEAKEAATASSDILPALPLSRPLAYFVALTSGFCAIAIEVLWSRGLSLSVSGSVYVFALILAAYLVGIGLGSLWVGQRHQSRAPRRETLSMAYLIVALGTIGTVFLFPKLLPMTLSMLKHRWVTSYDGYLGVVGGASVLMMLPATIAIGAALPLLIGLATNNPEEAEQMAGRLYGVNTIGGVLGSSLAIYWLMPTLGLTVSLVLFAGLYVLIACVVLASFFRDGSRGFLLMFWGGVVLFFAMMGQADDINPLKYRAGEKLLYYQDTSSGTIAIYQNRRGERVLRNNNYYGLSRTNAKTLTMQYRLGLLPVMLHKRPETTLLIGFATGTTLSAMASYPTVKRAECVELHGIIPKLAPYFAKANHRVWRAKNTRIQVADGRRYVLRSDKRYDVIVGDLYLPKNPGVGALYSVEHFRAVKRRLQKGGVFVSWMPAFQLGPKEMASVIRAFLMVFPKAEGWVSQWSTNSPVLGLVGTQDDSKVSVRPGFDQRLGQYVGQLLTDARTGRSRRLTLLSPASRPASRPVAQGKTPLRLVPSAALRKWSRDVPPNRLQRALIEFWSPRSMMEAKMKRFPLSYQNIAVLGRLGLLKGTPWEAVWHKLNKHPGAHWFPLKQ